MKSYIRIFALIVVVAGAVTGNSLAKNATVAAVHQGSVPGPIPVCDPWGKITCGIR